MHTRVGVQLTFTVISGSQSFSVWFQLRIDTISMLEIAATIQRLNKAGMCNAALCNWVWLLAAFARFVLCGSRWVRQRRLVGRLRGRLLFLDRGDREGSVLVVRPLVRAPVDVADWDRLVPGGALGDLH